MFQTTISIGEYSSVVLVFLLIVLEVELIIFLWDISCQNFFNTVFFLLRSQANLL